MPLPLVQCTLEDCKKLTEKSRECTNHKPQPLPQHQDEEKNDKN